MWLIDTATLHLKYFSNHPQGEYAILSHTWDEEEITFQDWTQPDIARAKKGFHKVEMTVRLAKRTELRYAWVDTCCIDKSSSAELSEAINSMYKWYEDAAVCFAWLADMPTHSDIALELETEDDQTIESHLARKFGDCAWFTRGWTLQELIAPPNVEFYDSEWNFYGLRNPRNIEFFDHHPVITVRGDTAVKRSLIPRISEITGVPPEVLVHSTIPQELPVACRMSWAAGRRTTRMEDMAYCLLGIFGINMSLLYGEGPRAFMRLQEEICKQSADLSLFAWRSEDVDRRWQKFRGIFAQSPSEFKGCDEFFLLRFSQTRYQGEFAVTNRGIRFERMPLYTGLNSGILMALECADLRIARSSNSQTAIALTKSARGYVRSSPDVLYDLSDYYDPRENRPGTRHENSRIYVSKELTKQEYLKVRNSTSELLEISLGPGVKVLAAEPKDLWDPYNKTFFSSHDNPIFSVHVEVSYPGHDTEEFVVVCGLNDPPDPTHTRWSRDLIYAGFGPADQEWRHIMKHIDNGLLQTPEVIDWTRKLLRSHREVRMSTQDMELGDWMTQLHNTEFKVHGRAMTGFLEGNMVSGPANRRFIINVVFRGISRSSIETSSRKD